MNFSQTFYNQNKRVTSSMKPTNQRPIALYQSQENIRDSYSDYIYRANKPSITNQTKMSFSNTMSSGFGKGGTSVDNNQHLIKPRTASVDPKNQLIRSGLKPQINPEHRYAYGEYDNQEIRNRPLNSKPEEVHYRRDSKINPQQSKHTEDRSLSKNSLLKRQSIKSPEIYNRDMYNIINTKPLSQL